MPRISLAILGPASLSRDGAPVALERQKALALLAYLALSGGPQGREALAALLWPDLAPARAAAALRQALWSIGAALGPEAVLSRRDGVAAGAIELDVDAFRANIAAARRGPASLEALAAAAALYRGDLLAGLELRDAAPFDEWRFFAAEALRADLAWALDALADGLAARGDLAGALAAARRRLALDPLHEPAHRRLMRLYAADGQRAAALRQHDELARLLRAELDADPEPETAALYAEIRRGGPPALAPPSAPAPLPRSAGPGLPAPTTAFVGREAELAAIEGLLADPACRLITLLGPGGIGKTRLAIQAAAALGPGFADGAAFAPLAAVSSSDLIPAALAAALGLPGLRADGVRAQVEDYLRRRELLLVVDNFEHLAEGAEILADLLEAAPRLRIMATSRERLALPGEWTLDIDGLPLPADDGGDSAALSLFAAAARRARPGAALSEEERRTAARICRMLGGAPLAIELAAAWTRLMPLAQVAEAIRRDLDFLAGAARGMPERHRGPRAVFDHSWRLLGEEERAAFARLSVFCGGFTLAAAAAVCQIPPQAVAAHLLALADKSLVRRTADERYDLHELLRQYAGERMAADPAGLRAAQDAHAAHFIGLLRSLEGDLKGARQPEALAAIEAELENVRMAWRWAVARVDRTQLRAALESLFHYYENRNRFEEGEDVFGRAAAAVAATEAASADDQILLGNLLARQGWFILRLYRFEAAQAILSWSLALLSPHAARPEAIFSSVIANFPAATGGWVRSPELLEQQLQRLRAGGDRWDLAFALHSLSLIAPSPAEAEDLLSQSLELSRAIGSHLQIARALDRLAGLLKDRVELSRARALWEECLPYYRALGHRWALAYALDQIGFAARQAGDLEAARRQHEESLAISRAIGDRLGEAGSLDNLGLVALDAGDLDRAEELMRAGLALREAVGHTGSTAVSWASLAALALACDDLAAARAGLSAAEELARAEGWLYLVGRARWMLARVDRLEGDRSAARAGLREAARTINLEFGLSEMAGALVEMAELRLDLGDKAAAAELAAALIAAAGEYVAVRRAAEAILARSGAPAGPPRPLAALVEEIRRWD